MEPTFSKSRQRAVMCMLGACNAGALLAAVNLVITLNPEDRISVRRGGLLTVLGFVYFMTLFELLNALAMFTGAGARFRHKYRLSCGEVFDITNKLVSAVQAALSCVTGAVVCAWSCTRDFLRSSHYMSEAYAWFGAAYFFYDIWSMYMVHVQMNANTDQKKSRGAKKACKNGDTALSSGDGGTSGGSSGGTEQAVAPTGPIGPARPAGPSDTSFLAYCRHEPVILMHHLFIGGFGFLVIVYFRGSFGDCAFGFVYLMELSTPLVSARGVLARLRLKSSRAYVCNGLLMLATFLACRVLSMPYVCLLYSRATGMTYLEAIKSLPTGCKVSICILMVPQLYWFYLMSAGAVKIFLGPGRRPEGALSAGDCSGKKS